MHNTWVADQTGKGKDVSESSGDRRPEPTRTGAPRLCALAILFAASALTLACHGRQADRHEARAAVPAGDAPARGPAAAWVTIVEFTDFECPFCADEERILDQVLAAYPQDVRLVFKNFPLPGHKDALPAALAAECARVQGKFWQMHDLLFDRQGSLKDEALREDATQVGLDLAAWQPCRSGKDTAMRVEADQQLGMQLGVNGTPAFFINGVGLEGALPFDKFQEVIDAEIRQAKTSGIPVADYYDRSVTKK